jgi:hypothetical protein
MDLEFEGHILRSESNVDGIYLEFLTTNWSLIKLHVEDELIKKGILKTLSKSTLSGADIPCRFHFQIGEPDVEEFINENLKRMQNK